MNDTNNEAVNKQEIKLDVTEGVSLGFGQVPDRPGMISLGSNPVSSFPEKLDDGEITDLTIEQIEKGMEGGTIDVETGTGLIQEIKGKEEKKRLESLTPREKADHNISVLEGKIKEFNKAKIEHQSIAHGYEGHIKTATDLLKRIRYQRKFLK